VLLLAVYDTWLLKAYETVSGCCGCSVQCAVRLSAVYQGVTWWRTCLCACVLHKFAPMCLTDTLFCAMQVRTWSDDAAAAGMLLSQTMYANRPGVHVVHVAAEMVPIAKVGCIHMLFGTCLAYCTRRCCVCCAWKWLLRWCLSPR
jgi:hypothetical protein